MHLLIAGMTGSGKTTLAKQLVQRYKLVNTPSIVLDPMRDPNWNAGYQTHDSADFLEKMYASRSCALFVDESGKTIGRYAQEMAVVTTESRHFGHKAHLLSQRPAQIDRNVRDQCSEVYLFRVGFTDGKTLAEEYGYPELKEVHTLQQGEFFHFTRFNPPKKLVLFKPQNNA